MAARTRIPFKESPEPCILQAQPLPESPSMTRSME
jgi:hypothetical protein